MYVKKYILSVFIFISCIVLTVGIIVKSKFRVTKNKRINATSYGEAEPHSTTACSSVCKSSKNCTAANYLKETRKCYLFNLNACAVRLEDAPGWIYLSRLQGQRIFYHISSQTSTWNNAKNYCKSIGGDLASVNSPTDHDIILNIISQLQHRVWIGGSDVDSEGDWIWSNGCKFNDQDFDFWRSGNPDNWNDNEHCLELYDSEWNDQDCSYQRSFVCEINVA